MRKFSTNVSEGFGTMFFTKLYAKKAEKKGFKAKITVCEDVPWGILGTFHPLGAKYWVALDKKD